MMCIPRLVFFFIPGLFVFDVQIAFVYLHPGLSCLLYLAFSINYQIVCTVINMNMLILYYIRI